MAIQLGSPDQGGDSGFGQIASIYAQAAARRQQHAAPPIIQGPTTYMAGGAPGGGAPLGDRDVFQANAAQEQQQQRAQLQSWLMNQDMTQHETLRLQQQKNALGAIQADPDLSDEEKQQYTTQLQVPINIGQQRLQAMQLRAMQGQEQVAQQRVAAQTAMVNENQRFLAAGFPASQSYTIDPTAEQNIRDELQRWAAPGEQVPEAEVLREAGRRGAVSRWVQHRDGTWEQAGGPQRQGRVSGSRAQATTEGEAAPVQRTGQAQGLPPGVMDENTWQKHFEAIQKEANTAGPQGAPLTGQARTDFIHNQLNERGLHWTHSDYLDERIPGRREARQLRADQDTQRHAAHAAMSRIIDEAGLPSEERSQLQAIRGGMESALERYRRPEDMPAFIRQRYHVAERMLDLRLDQLRAQAQRRPVAPAALAAPAPPQAAAANEPLPPNAPGTPILQGISRNLRQGYNQAAPVVASGFGEFGRRIGALTGDVSQRAHDIGWWLHHALER